MYVCPFFERMMGGGATGKQLQNLVSQAESARVRRAERSRAALCVHVQMCMDTSVHEVLLSDMCISEC